MNYTANDLIKMQEEAVRRVREMQNRVNKAASYEPSEVKPNITQNQKEEKKTAPKPEINSSNFEFSSIKQLFGGDFKINSDMLIIGALAYLLYKQKADIKIILALGYILL